MLVQELRHEIYMAIAPTIDMRRASISMSRQEIPNSSNLVEDKEVDEFLLSNPLYDQSVVQLLWLPPGVNPAAVNITIDDEWLNDFQVATHEWARNSSWLAGDDPWITVATQQTVDETQVLWIPGKPLTVSSFSLAPTTLDVASRILREGRELTELNWRQLEELIADLLHSEGWSVTLTPPTHDGGVDVFAAREDPVIGPILTIWQAKKYQIHRKVQLSAIRELITVRDEHAASKGFIVTTSAFTSGALEKVTQDRHRMGAISGPDLEFWVRRIINESHKRT